MEVITPENEQPSNEPNEPIENADNIESIDNPNNIESNENDRESDQEDLEENVNDETRDGFESLRFYINTQLEILEDIVNSGNLYLEDSLYVINSILSTINSDFT